jgi:hypothetical protein
MAIMQNSLHPTHIRRQVRQILKVAMIEVEQNIGTAQQVAPARLLLGRALDAVVVVAGIARCR